MSSLFFIAGGSGRFLAHMQLMRQKIMALLNLDQDSEMCG